MLAVGVCTVMLWLLPKMNPTRRARVNSVPDLFADRHGVCGHQVVVAHPTPKADIAAEVSFESCDVLNRLNRLVRDQYPLLTPVLQGTNHSLGTWSANGR